jgi:sugar O-acyltransferase (sialic acid O-acetyltransferase NeuD family)
MATDDRPVLILGAGGHAKVVLSILQACRREAAAVVGRLPDRTNGFGEVPVIPDDDEALARAKDAGLSFIVAIGDNQTRRVLYERFLSEGVPASSAVHPAAVVASGAEYGSGNMVGAMAVVGPAARVGANTVINTGAIVEHDCVIGDHVHVAPGVRMGGQVSVGDGALVGMGAVLLPGVQVGPAAVIGAGAVVLRDVPAGETLVGVPAKPLHGGRASCTV